MVWKMTTRKVDIMRQILIVLITCRRKSLYRGSILKCGQIGLTWVTVRLQIGIELTYIAHLIPFLCPAILNMKTKADDFTKAKIGLYSRPTTHVQNNAGV